METKFEIDDIVKIVNNREGGEHIPLNAIARVVNIQFNTIDVEWASHIIINYDLRNDRGWNKNRFIILCKYVDVPKNIDFKEFINILSI